MLAYVALLAIVAVQLPLVINLRHRGDAEARLRVVGQAAVTAVNAAGVFGRDDRRALRHLVATAGASGRSRVVVVNRAGRVVADSAPGARLRRDESRRADVAAALRGGHSERFVHSGGREMLRAAVPLLQRGVPAGAVVVSEDVESLRSASRHAVVGLIVLGGLVVLAGLIAGVMLAAQLARPLRRLDAAARRIADGDLATRAPVEGTVEQRSLARSFNDMTERLARALRSQQDFVADASHQLRTPIAGLQLRLEEAVDVGMPSAAAEEVEAGLGELQRLSNIVDELLVLSRAGERDAPGEAVDLREEAMDAAERWRPRAVECGLRLAVSVPDGPVPAWCAPVDLQRAADALIENAVQYSPAGTTVTVAVGEGSLEILDEGPGLDETEASEVFERFRRGRAGRARISGSGLGLPIARELARRWGGEATIENRNGSGARAAITLPRFPNT